MWHVAPMPAPGAHQWYVPVGELADDCADVAVMDACMTRDRPKSATLARRSSVRSTLGDWNSRGKKEAGRGEISCGGHTVLSSVERTKTRAHFEIKVNDGDGVQVSQAARNVQRHPALLLRAERRGRGCGGGRAAVAAPSKEAPERAAGQELHHDAGPPPPPREAEPQDAACA